MPGCNWVNQTGVIEKGMVKDTDIAWLAGLIDGEGCLYLAQRTDKYATRTSRRSGDRVEYGPYFQVRCDLKLAMADKPTIVYAAGIIAEIVGGTDGIVVREERRKTPRARPLWRVELSAKQIINTVLLAIRPYMITKALEADLCLDYLSRALTTSWHRATERDLLQAKLATALRHGSGEARIEALATLDQVIPSQAIEGTAQAGSLEGVETRDLTARNNSPHECPAPHLALVEQEGEEIVRTTGENLCAV